MSEEIISQIEMATKAAAAKVCGDFIGERRVAMKAAWSLFKFAKDRFKTFGEAIRQGWKWVREVCRPWTVSPVAVPPEKVPEVIRKYFET